MTRSRWVNSARPAMAALMSAVAISLVASSALAARVTLPAGTVIPVKLNQPLSSKTNRPGDRFTAAVRYGRDDAGLPEGTYVTGIVREALPAAEGKPGVLDVDFRSITFPDGQTKALDASLISLSDKGVKRSSSGTLVATTNKSKDRLKFIGIGAGAGLVIAALTKGNALLDTLLGAGAGYAYNELKKDKPGDVKLGAGTEFGVRLDRQFAFNAYGSRAAAHRSDDFLQERRSRDDRYYGDREDSVVRGRDNGSAIGVLVNDREVRFNRAKPFMRDDIVYVPLEAVSRVANFEYRYDSLNKVIFARNDNLRMGLDSRIAVVNGERRRLDASPLMRGGELYVPMQFIALATNGSAYWDGSSRTVVVTTRDYDRDRRP